MYPLFDNLEEMIPDKVFDKLDSMKEIFDEDKMPKTCIYCGCEISHRWMYSSDKICTFEVYCISGICKKKAPLTISYDSSYPEFTDELL